MFNFYNARHSTVYEKNFCTVWRDEYAGMSFLTTKYIVLVKKGH
jgi:hypothetical protein